MLAYAMPNQVWPDEHFQSLEQAHRIVFGYGVVPWEFRVGTRSWLLPGLLTAIMGATSAVTSSASAYLMTCAAALSAISLGPIWSTFRAAFAVAGLRGALAASLILTVWFELVYFAPKALNEVVAGNILAVGVLMTDSCVRSMRGGREVTVRSLMIATCLLALASMLRIQLAIASFGCFVYLIYRLHRRRQLYCVAAGAGVVLAAGLLDAITWSYPFQSFIENIRINIVVARSELYGVAPWWAYFDVYAQIWGIGGLVILTLAGIGARLRPLLALSALAVLIAHVPIAHKEYRFMYPAMLLVIILASLGVAEVIRWAAAKRGPRLATLIASSLVVLVLALSARSANGFHESKTQLARASGPPQWHWALHSGAMAAAKKLGETPDVCGIGLIYLNVFSTGGYAYVHRDIPLFEVLSPADAKGLVPYVNVYIIGRKPELPEALGAFVRQECIAEVCIYKRPGACNAMPGYHFNEILKQRND